MANETLYFIGVKAVIKNQEGQYLLLRITRRRDNYVYWDLPGGRITGDETAIETLKREIEEETSITDLRVVKPLIMALSGVHLPLDDGGQAGIVFDVYLCTTATIKLKTEENMTAKWGSPTEIAALLEQNTDYPAGIVDAVKKA